MKKQILLCLAVITVVTVLISTGGFAYQIEPQATKSAKIILKFENWKT